MGQTPPPSRILDILTGAIENTNEAFVTIDQDHKVIIFNHAAEKIFGYTREEVLGADLRHILGPECREGHEAAVARFVAKRQPRLIGHETEFLATRKNGQRFPAALSFSVAEIEQQLYFTALIRDLTETKQLQEKVLKAERLAALGQVVAEISHEIKNPLLLIGGSARQLLKKAPEQQIAKLRLIVDEVTRLEGLLAELRNLYLPRRPRPEEIRLNDLLHHVYSLVQSGAKERKIFVSFRPAAADPVIAGDRERLTQAFLNLVKNGLEALAGGGRLEICADLGPQDTVLVEIADTGPGIPSELMEDIFKPFFTTKKRGTGLGLAISKRLIEDHPGGSLTVHSTTGEGTRVRVILPVAGDRPHQGG